MSRSERHLKHRYGITLKEFAALADKQGNRCPICQKEFTPKGPTQPVVDHDHLTGDVRGILCHRCNQAVGWFEDMEENLPRLNAYLGRHR